MIHLKTQRLLLCPPKDEDFNYVVKVYTDQEMMKFLGGALSIDLVKKLFANWLNQWNVNKFSVGILREIKTNKRVGVAGIFPPAIVSEKGAEIGFMIDKAFQQKGYALDISKALIDVTFTYKLSDRIIAYPHIENKLSIKLFKKMNFSNLGKRSFTIPEAPNFKEQVLFELLKDNWSKFSGDWTVY